MVNEEPKVIVHSRLEKPFRNDLNIALRGMIVKGEIHLLDERLIRKVNLIRLKKQWEIQSKAPRVLRIKTKMMFLILSTLIIICICNLFIGFILNFSTLAQFSGFWLLVGGGLMLLQSSPFIVGSWSGERQAKRVAHEGLGVS